eukprot:gene22113-26646_t
MWAVAPILVRILIRNAADALRGINDDNTNRNVGDILNQRRPYKFVGRAIWQRIMDCTLIDPAKRPTARSLLRLFKASTIDPAKQRYNAFPLHTQSLLLDVYGDRQLTYSRFAQAGECTLTPAASFFEFAGMPRAVWFVPQFGEGLLRLRVYNTPTDGSICHGWWGEVVLVYGRWGQPQLHFTNAFQAFFSTELYQELSDAPLSRIAAPTTPRVPSTLSTRNELGVEVDRMTSVYTTFTEWRAAAHHRARCSWCKTKLPRKARTWCMCKM